MTARPPERTEQASQAKGWEKTATWLALGVFLIAYLAGAVLAASQTTLWMDEVLTTWAARLPNPAAIYSALAHGSEFAPPTFPLLLHYFTKVAGGSNLALRVPSILAIVVAVGCSFSLMRRYLGLERAAFGAVLALEGLRVYALQARPYALVCACMAVALVLWDSPNRTPGRQPAWWRSAAIALVLAFAISLHFYAVLLVPCLGLMELLYAWRTKAFRPAMWIALVFGGASILIWKPLMNAMSRYVSMDSSSPAYYARPTFERLLSIYDTLFLRGTITPLLLFAALFVSAIALFLGMKTAEDAPEASDEGRIGFGAMLIGLAVFPLIVFVFSRFVTKAFAERYTIAAELGISAIVAASLRVTPLFRRAAPLLVALAAVLTLGHQSMVPRPVDVVRDLPGQYPVVVASGKNFFELLELATPEEKKRLIYLTAPTDVVLPDPTNEHQIERWKAINSDLRVEDLDQFLSTNDRFYVVDGPSFDGASARLLLDRHRLALLKSEGGMQLYESRPAPSQAP